MSTTYQGRHRRRDSTLVAWARRAGAALLALAAVAGLAATTATAATHPSSTTQRADAHATQLPGRHADPNWDRHAHATPAETRIHPGRSAPGAERFRAEKYREPTATSFGMYFRHTAHIRTGPSARRTSLGLGMRGDDVVISRVVRAHPVLCQRGIAAHPGWYLITDRRTGKHGWVSACLLSAREP